LAASNGKASLCVASATQPSFENRNAYSVLRLRLISRPKLHPDIAHSSNVGEKPYDGEQNHQHSGQEHCGPDAQHRQAALDNSTNEQLPGIDADRRQEQNQAEISQHVSLSMRFKFMWKPPRSK
jgi:hypothetical protein